MDINYDKLAKDPVLSHILSSLAVKINHWAGKCYGACRTRVSTLDDWKMIMIDKIFEIYDERGGYETLGYYFSWAKGAAWREVERENKRHEVEQEYTQRNPKETREEE